MLRLNVTHSKPDEPDTDNADVGKLKNRSTF